MSLNSCILKIVSLLNYWTPVAEYVINLATEILGQSGCLCCLSLGHKNLGAPR